MSCHRRRFKPDKTGNSFTWWRRIPTNAASQIVEQRPVDFGKLRRAQGYEPGWLMSKLLDGERPVSGTARIHSGGGKVTVEIERASISGVEIDGKTLEFLIQNFIVPFYPSAMVGRPVAMSFRIDRLQLAPTGVGVVIGR